MSEIEKLYENANADKDCKLYANYGACPDKTKECTYCEYYVYPEFTAEKQLEIENVILQNKKNYNKWIEYNLNVYGEWVIRFVRTDKFAPYIALEKTRAEALANVINYFWQDLTDTEKAEIKRILEC